jgi:hypothetical protein
VSLLCKVVSVPESTLEWVLNGQPLSNSSLNVFIETSSPYYVGPLGPIEKKSELLILNATSEENGTFLCSATNPAGTATANFTLRVIIRTDEDLTQEGFVLLDIPTLIANYPNLFLILLSTFSVIILLLGLLPIVFLICKCTRVCRRRKQGPSSSSTIPTDTSTTLSAAKSNVFLLSSPDTDSNPDIIEEATKRVEGDGSNTPGHPIPNYDHHSHQHYYQIPPPPPQLYSVPAMDLAKYPKQYYHHPYELPPPGQGYVYGVYPELRCGCIPEGDETEGGGGGGHSVGVGLIALGGHGSPDEGYHGETEGTEI